MGVFLRFFWRVDLSQVEMKQMTSLENLPPKSRREKATVLIFMSVVLLWVLPELIGGLLPDVATFLKGAGMAFPPMIGVILLAILSFEGKPHLKGNHSYPFKKAYKKGSIGQVCSWWEQH